MYLVVRPAACGFGEDLEGPCRRGQTQTDLIQDLIGPGTDDSEWCNGTAVETMVSVGPKVTG